MHALGPQGLGVLILVLLAALLVVKRLTTGSILEKAPRRIFLQVVNLYNLTFLIVVNPLTAILLLTGRWPGGNFLAVDTASSGLLRIVEGAGLAVYLGGFGLMAWALIQLGRGYQLGGEDPRAGDVLNTGGPYARVRHPMYTAALAISLGLAGLTVSPVLLGVFVIYLVLVLLLIPLEEEGLVRTYGEQYVAYRAKTRRLLPLLY